MPAAGLANMTDFLDLEQKLDPGFRVSMFNSNFTLSDPKTVTDCSETQKGKINENRGKWPMCWHCNFFSFIKSCCQQLFQFIFKF